MANQQTLYPLEFQAAGTPVSLRASPRSREAWKTLIREAARERIRQTDALGFLERRPLAVTVYYFPAVPMIGDIDNIVKPIMDALIGIAYIDDQDVERLIVQRFEPTIERNFAVPSEQLSAALDAAAPLVYVRVDNDVR